MFDDKFVDVDFTKDQNYVGGFAGMGSMNVCMNVGDSVQIINEGDWPALMAKQELEKTSLDYLVTRIYSQANEGSCCTADTEVLTEKGWVPWPEYNWNDHLGTVNQETGMLEFQAPTQKHVYDYDGDIVYSKNSRVDFGVTPNHRMYVRKWSEPERKLSSKYTFTEAGKIGWCAGLMSAPTGHLGTELIELGIEGDREYRGDDLIALISVLVSDGYASKPGTQSQRVSFCCFNKDRYQKIKELAERTGFTEQPSRPGVFYRYGAAAQPLIRWLWYNMYTDKGFGARHKKVPDLIKVASQRQIRLFMEYFGDQTHARAEAGNPQFFSSSKRLIDDLQELHLRIGKRGTIGVKPPRTGTMSDGRRVSGGESYVLSISKTDELTLCRKQHIELRKYTGKVYCATVPNSTLITRRNGTILISGNCVANATAQSHEIVQARQFGKPNVIHLSAMSLYKRIGSSPGSGAMVSDGIMEMKERGILPLDNEHNRVRFGDKVMPNTGWSTPYPSDWQPTAKHFRCTEFFSVRGTKQLVTCLLLNMPVVVGRQGHSICYVRAFIKDGRLYVKYVNSWGKWGVAGGDLEYGFGIDSEGTIAQAAQEAFAIRAVVMP